MSVFSSLVSFLPPLLLGFLLVCLFWSKEKSVFSDLPTKCALSVGFGFAASSCLVFLWMMIAGRLTRAALLCELLLIAGLCVLLLRRQRPGPPSQASQPNKVNTPALRKPYLLRLVFSLATFVAAIRFCYLTGQYPQGQYDAFSIWNLRARFLYRGAQYWKEFIHATVDSHTDYPLLVPASIARSWEFVGRDTLLIPCVIALLFTFGTIALVATAVSHMRGERQGLLAGLVLLGTPALISHGASQGADVPLGFFFVATAVLLFLHEESPSKHNFLILAGLAAASAAWTKNEGILFVVLLFFLWPAVAMLAEKPKQWRSEFLALVIGAAPVTAILLVYKICLVTRNDLVAGQGIASTIPRLLSVSRYHVVVHWFVSLPFFFGQWNPFIAMPVLLLFYFLLLGGRVPRNELPAISTSVLLVIFMSVGYFFVYILSPLDLTWHLGSSLDRLLLQIWPLVVFTYFVFVQTPEQALLSDRVETMPA
jgi:4-amino-4-deoxy-L-arabinose transferase-like glycosyltransferase